MKSAQFIHIETYSKKSAKKKDKVKNLNHRSDNRETTVSGVLNEAKRLDGFTPHIDSPESPEQLYGCSMDDLEALVDEYHQNSYTIDKNGQKKGLRSDASVLLAGVISINREDEIIWDDYKKDSLEFLKKKYGDNLKSVIEHTDEKNPHMHFYVTANVNEKLNDLHDGKLAVSKLSKDEKKNQKAVYIKSMTEFQDDFYNKVSKKYDLDRLGEKPRKRMSRKEYLEYELEKKVTTEILEEKQTEISKIDEIVSEARTEASEEGFKSGLEKGLEKSNNLAVRLNNIIEKIRFKKTDLEIMLEKKVNKLEKRVSNLIKRKNMYKKKSLDFEEDYKRIRSKYQKTEEFQRELKQLQMMNEYNALPVDDQKKQNPKPKPKHQGEDLVSPTAIEITRKLPKI